MKQLRNLFVEFEFNSLGRRLFGEDFKAGRGFAGGSTVEKNETTSPPALSPADGGEGEEKQKQRDTGFAFVF